VYGLAQPSHDRQALIFCLINGSLVLIIVSHVLVRTTRTYYFAIGPGGCLFAHACPRPPHCSGLVISMMFTPH
jgi:hypothetical protein